MGEGQEQTVGDRIYLIREALGTRRDPMPLEQFAALISATTGVVYDKSVISRMETGDRKVSLEDVGVLAAVDPLRRGKGWLAWGEEGGGNVRRDSGPPQTPRAAPREIPKEYREHRPAAKKIKRRPPNDRTAMAV